MARFWNPSGPQDPRPGAEGRLCLRPFRPRGEPVRPGKIEGTLAIRGTSRAVRLKVASPGPGQYRGSTTIRQTDFGVTPYSGFFGALKLRDELVIEFEVSVGSAAN